MNKHLGMIITEGYQAVKWFRRSEAEPPKDGTRFLAIENQTGMGETEILFWDRNRREYVDDNFVNCVFTHWMLQPEPPED